MFFSFQLKKEQEMQKQMLWHTFQEKNKQLELQHKLQLEHKYQVKNPFYLLLEIRKRTASCSAIRIETKTIQIPMNENG